MPRLRVRSAHRRRRCAQVHREQLSYVDIVLAGCASALETRGKVSEGKARCCLARREHLMRASALTDALDCTTVQATKQLVSLLTSPLDAYDVVSVLSLSSYPKVRLCRVCVGGC
jgi:hypothetical protein